MPYQRHVPEHWLEMLHLMCRCGGSASGLVRNDRASGAIALFAAHHMGPACKPTHTLREADSSPWMVGRQGRLDPAALCGSAWWKQRSARKEGGGGGVRG